MGLFPTYKQKPIIPSKHVQHELVELDLDLFDVVHVLKYGYNCSKSRRKSKIIEKCIEHGKKELRVVTALVEWENKAFWRLIHVSKSRKSKRK